MKSISTRRSPLLALVLASISACSGEYRIGGVAKSGQCAPLALDVGPLASIGPDRRSPYAAPWRALVRTRSAATLLGSIGWGVLPLPSYDVLAPRAAAAHVARAKVFTHWADAAFDDVARLQPAAEQRLRASLQAIAAAGLRPTLTLTSLPNVPAPNRQDDVRLMAPADAGTQTMRFDATAAGKITRGATMVMNVGTSDAVGPFITAIAADGTASLSRALPRRIEAGTVRLVTFEVLPFSHPRDAAGAPNASYAASLGAWLGYVGAVTTAAKDALGPGKFDIDLGNPAATFLDLNAYHDVDVDHGSGDTAAEVFAATVRALRDPSRGLGEIDIGDGVHNASRAVGVGPLVAGVSAFERNAAPGFTSLAQPMAQPGVPVDALGREEGRAQGDGTWLDPFTPGDELYFPELPLTANSAQSLVWDFIARDAVGEGALWIAATHLDPQGPAKAGVSLTEAQRWRLLAKARLREIIAYAAVGSEATQLFGLLDDPSSFVDPSAVDGGPVFAALARAFDRVTKSPPGALRALTLAGATSCAAALEFAGDGSDGHPPLRVADELVFAPFQTGAHSFIVATYAMTRSLLRVRRPDLPFDAVERFDLPDIRVTVEVKGLSWSSGSRATLYDPVQDVTLEVPATSHGSDRLGFDLGVSDSPRLLLLDGV